jgi:hypothetical protein
VNADFYNTGITLDVFSNHLSTVKTYLDGHSNETAKCTIIYAWNEWGEGGIIEPAYTLGYTRLDTIQAVFGLKPRLARGPASFSAVAQSESAIAVNIQNLTAGITNSVEQSHDLAATSGWSFLTNFVSATAQTNLVLGWSNGWDKAFFRIKAD